MNQLELSTATANKFIINAGDEATFMGILLDGTVTSWQPLTNKAMLRPLMKLRNRIKTAISLQVSSLHDFNFMFHLDPKELPGSYD